jgi:hypothetical protein
MIEVDMTEMEIETVKIYLLNHCAQKKTNFFQQCGAENGNHRWPLVRYSMDFGFSSTERPVLAQSCLIVCQNFEQTSKEVKKSLRRGSKTLHRVATIRQGDEYILSRVKYVTRILNPNYPSSFFCTRLSFVHMTADKVL